MIKKITVFSLLSALSFGSAGDAGAVCNPCSSVFLSLEGSYTKNSIDSFEFDVLGTPNSLFTVKQNQLGGGRIAAGVMRFLCDELGASAEIGWGSYGRTRLTAEGTGIFAAVPATFSAATTITGFDALVGASFLQPCYSLFLKAGALVEMNHSTFDATFDPLTPIIFTSNTFHFQGTRTGVLPEVKIGGSYIFNDNWSLTVAYMHAFGSTVGARATFDPVTGSANFDARFPNPSLSSVMVGVQLMLY